MAKQWERLDAAEVGEKVTIKICESDVHYKAEINRRDKTHTYVKHKHGETALPNNIGIELIAIKRHE